MAVSGNYPSPVIVNGYLCWNCTDVDNAHNHIDPAHPKDGPFDLAATTGAASSSPNPAVQLSGVLAAAAAPGGAPPAYQPGSRLNVAA